MDRKGRDRVEKEVPRFRKLPRYEQVQSPGATRTGGQVGHYPPLPVKGMSGPGVERSKQFSGQDR